MTLSPSPFAYEFRFFGASLLYERALLLARARAHETYRTSESYILSRGVNDVNVKIRAGRIEVKLLTARAGPLEGWERAFEADLPVTANTFATQVAARLGVDVRTRERPRAQRAGDPPHSRGMPRSQRRARRQAAHRVRPRVLPFRVRGADGRVPPRRYDCDRVTRPRCRLANAATARLHGQDERELSRLSQFPLRLAAGLRERLVALPTRQPIPDVERDAGANSAAWNPQVRRLGIGTVN